jgi:hypothetical protein
VLLRGHWARAWNACVCVCMCGAQLYFRGIRNLDATLDLLLSDYGLQKATQVRHCVPSCSCCGTLCIRVHIVCGQ